MRKMYPLCSPVSFDLDKHELMERELRSWFTFNKDEKTAYSKQGDSMSRRAGSIADALRKLGWIVKR